MEGLEVKHEGTYRILTSDGYRISVLRSLVFENELISWLKYYQEVYDMDEPNNHHVFAVEDITVLNNGTKVA